MSNAYSEILRAHAGRQKESTARQATPHLDLLADLLDSCTPKTEREHAAVREIERLQAELAQAKTAYELVQKDCQNLTEKVIPTARAAERERCAQLCEQYGQTLGSIMADRIRALGGE